jgi:AcrR family transcriptional regulator
VTTRDEQRARTRRALIQATSDLLEEGIHPTIDEVAERAGLSRATAYRHFPSIDDLLWQVSVNRTITSVTDTYAGAGDDIYERVARCEHTINGLLLGDPVGTRAFERSTLQRWLERGPEAAERPARRVAYIDAALEPIVDHIAPAALTRLRNALALVIGTQATIALTDVCNLDTDQAHELAQWIAETLVRETLNHHT